MLPITSPRLLPPSPHLSSLAASTPTKARLSPESRLKTRVSLLADDPAHAESVAQYLVDQGFEVDLHSRARFSPSAVAEARSDLVILDLGRSDTLGLDLCRELRASGISIPVIMLSSRGEAMERILALEFGADDYVVKPVRDRLLLAHLRAVLRRVARARQAPGKSEASALSTSRAGLTHSGVVEYGSLRIDHHARRVTRFGASIDLTSSQFDLLWTLATNPGKTLKRADILRLLGSKYACEGSRSIDSRMSRLRKRLEMDGLSVAIKTVRPQGYLFSPVGW